ncbi:hypothetical protein O181_002423 [Austropuccinia psidii MF-1]|uniref:Uncharacterized protein n=1 Tax=Austropuccinia psidii MF-1 TaxID=1389203 RepID=A0A9Q3BCG4_9BASI|nr:hypothetical protein [Austropuccinia psidii MF-1]
MFKRTKAAALAFESMCSYSVIMIGQFESSRELTTHLLASPIESRMPPVKCGTEEHNHRCLSTKKMSQRAL